MHEHIVALVASDESIPLLDVEPLYGAGFLVVFFHETLSGCDEHAAGEHGDDDDDEFGEVSWCRGNAQGLLLNVAGDEKGDNANYRTDNQAFCQ